MPVLKLAKYAGDGDRLEDEADATFVKRKVGPDSVLDFSGVLDVSPGFLDVLLEGESPESIADRIQGAEGAVDGALAAWSDRQSQAPTPIERPKARPKVRVPQKGN